MSQPSPKRMGRVALIGLPNAGKSTLLNRLAARPLSVVTHKAQTTRMPVSTWMQENTTAMLITDTAGLGRNVRVARVLSRAAWAAADEADVVLCFIDASAKARFPAAKKFLREAQEKLGEVVIVFNKTDLAGEKKIVAQVEEIKEQAGEVPVFLISAKRGQGVDALKAHCLAAMPLASELTSDEMDKEQSSDVFLAAEITRGKILERVHEEIPYAVSIIPQSWKKKKGGGREVRQTIEVEREKHKMIIIGRGGQTLRAIGEAARHDMETLFGGKTDLFLFVRLRRKSGGG